MQIINQISKINLVATSPEEKGIIDRIIAEIDAPCEIKYKGRMNEVDERFVRINLNFGGQPTIEKSRTGTIRVSHHTYTGGIDLWVSGTSEEDKFFINGLRNKLFFGSSKLRYLGSTEDRQGIIIAFDGCKLCGIPVNRLVEVEWAICDNCAKSCNHEWTEGILHGSNEIVVGEYCRICGRAK